LKHQELIATNPQSEKSPITIDSFNTACNQIQREREEEEEPEMLLRRDA